MSTLWTITSSSFTREARIRQMPDGAQMPEPPQKGSPVTPWPPTALHAIVQTWFVAEEAGIT